MTKKTMKWAIPVICVAAVIVILIAAVAIKTATFSSKQIAVDKKVSFPVDMDKATHDLSNAIQYKTVFDMDTSKVDYSQFTGLQQYLDKSFPLVSSTFDKKVINGYGLLYVWKGSDSGKKPILLMAHQDVVPAPAEGWTHQPFSGDIDNGVIWGRGAIDDKGSLISIFEAMEYLIKDGFKPSRTIYIASGFDEEVTGLQGAGKISEYLKSEGVRFEAIYDEGLIVTQGDVPGVKTPVALIGTAEKGYLSVTLTAQSEGGHSSMPPKQTTIGIIAAAINKLENNPFPIRMTGPAADLFAYAGPEMSFPYKMLFANMWLFGPVIESELAATPSTNAAIRTTTAPTIINAGVADNVLPSKATATVNFRILPGDTMQSVIARVKSTVNDPRVDIQPITASANDPAPVSSTTSADFTTLNTTIRKVMPDVFVAPMMMIGATDSFKYIGLADNIYRFLPERLYGDDLNMMHGMNER
ncbi:MAG TPA: M20 family peptidase, partial [Dissulfurispiraceae bacterium]|nr:M20 family peptidase [Dissulfurispiraceae bacterium]